MSRSLDPTRLAFLASLVAIGSTLSSPFTAYFGLAGAVVAYVTACFFLGRP